MKVYVVTRGEYSDYSIDKVFLDKEKAEKYAELYSKGNCYDTTRVEEYIVYDEFFDSKLTGPIEFYVQYINLESGKLGWDGKEKVLSSATSFCEFDGGDMLKAGSQKSAEHAKKIAIEQYQIHTQRIYEEQMSYEEYFEKYLANMKGAING
jgi:hypothetical protein